MQRQNIQHLLIAKCLAHHKYSMQVKEKVVVTQSYPTLCNPMDCSPPDSSVQGILQARILEWVAIPFSRGSSWPRAWTRVSCVASRFFTIWAIGKSQGSYKQTKAVTAIIYKGLLQVNKKKANNPMESTSTCCQQALHRRNTNGAWIYGKILTLPAIRRCQLKQ